MMVTPSSTTVVAGLRALAVPAGLGGEVDDHGSRPHRAYRVGR